MRIQRQAAISAEEFTRTGSEESKKQLSILSGELDSIIDRTVFRSGGIVNATFATRIRQMRDGFDQATGNLTQGFSEALTTQGGAVRQQLDAIDQGATAQTGELREGLGGQLSALEGAREGQLRELETGTAGQIGAVETGTEGQLAALREGAVGQIHGRVEILPTEVHNPLVRRPKCLHPRRQPMSESIGIKGGYH